MRYFFSSNKHGTQSKQNKSDLKYRTISQSGACIRAKSQRGMALFMVMSSLAILSVVVAGLTYSTQMHQRLTYNFLDGLRAYYLAKAGVRIGLLRLNAYFQVKSMLGESQNKALSQMIDASIIEKIWNIPLIFPLPAPPEASPLQKDEINKFNQETSF